MIGPKKLKLDALRSDLASVEAMIARATQFNDAIGQHQFQERKEALESEIAGLEGVVDNTARAAIFFGGGPVLGSRGIEADFAGEALRAFQEIVQKTLAVEEQGALGTRGRVSNKAASQLLITDIARGSFGFLLEEAAAGEALAETELKVILGRSSNLIADVASPSSATFETALADVDSRTLISLRKFFDVLDSSHATLRLVEGNEEFSLQRSDVTRARYRVDATEIVEEELNNLDGILFYLPQHKTFEFTRSDTGETMFGKVDESVIRQLIASGQSVGVGVKWRAHFKVKRARRHGQPEKSFYRLSALSEADG